MKKLNIRVILFQLLGMIFLIHGVLQLRFYTVAEKFICATNHFQEEKSECWNRLFPAKDDIFNFLPSIYIWIFLGLSLGVIIIAFLNWKNKLSALNTILVSIIMYIILRLKFFRKGVFSRLFDYFTSAFSDDLTTQFIIGGITFTVIGITILWISTDPNLFNFRKVSN
ncbi:hypothetical protein [Flavobacterium piscis]|uniref:Uncharacterized protein n=1 Tax=Flavobacterium piscis TaxID=1114874 RepID=A0ABU1Y3R0_9FLAO|nr:hypothetical protein [Flavobacterium piscis]MDR7208867.1 hypothetical protein [Flavobacterium piscis]